MISKLSVSYLKLIKEEIKWNFQTKINLKKVFYYDTEPTEITKRIEKITRYARKQNLLDEIKRIENSDDPNKEKKKILKKRIQ